MGIYLFIDVSIAPSVLLVLRSNLVFSFFMSSLFPPTLQNSQKDLELQPSKKTQKVKSKMGYYQFWSLDTRSLSYARILFGLFILFDIYSRLSLSIHWYTSNEDASISYIDDTPHGSPIHRFFFYRGSTLFQTMIFILQIIITICYTIGYKIEYCSIWVWIFLTCMHGRQEGKI